MSKTLDDLRDRWARQRFQRAMQQYQSVMVKHSDLMGTENGMMSMLLVQLAALGNAPPAALAHTIKQASILSGIPEEALEAHARFSSEMLTCFEFDQLNKSPR